MRRMSFQRGARSIRAGGGHQSPCRRLRVAMWTVRAMVRLLRFRFMAKLSPAETSQLRALYVHESPLFRAAETAAVLRATGISCSAEVVESILLQGTQHREGSQLKWRCFERLLMALKFLSRGNVDHNKHEGAVAFSALGPDQEGLVPKETVVATLQSFELNSSAFPELRKQQRNDGSTNRRGSDNAPLEPRGMCLQEFEHCFIEMSLHERTAAHSSSTAAIDATPHLRPIADPTGPSGSGTGVAANETDDPADHSGFLLEGSYRPHPPQSSSDPQQTSNGVGVGLSEFFRSARQWIDNTPKHFRDSKAAIPNPPPATPGAATKARPPLSTPRESALPAISTPRVAAAHAFQSSSKRFFETLPLQALPSPKGSANPQPIRPNPSSPDHKKKKNKKKHHRASQKQESPGRLMSFSATS